MRPSCLPDTPPPPGGVLFQTAVPCRTPGGPGRGRAVLPGVRLAATLRDARGRCGRSSFRPSFWYHPGARSVTHKGVDIFARKGTPFVRRPPAWWSSPANWAWAEGGAGAGPAGGCTTTPTWNGSMVAGALAAARRTAGHRGRHRERQRKAAPPALYHRNTGPVAWQVRPGPHGLRRMWYVDPTPLLNGAS